mmetsp:Transcript_129578/g.223898  ORF Transcript_129578/g.223898 Transcript_129578/m.223898 type:complete len:91 (+) Transcript_129578:526-798(+)
MGGGWRKRANILISLTAHLSAFICLATCSFFKSPPPSAASFLSPSLHHKTIPPPHWAAPDSLYLYLVRCKKSVQVAFFDSSFIESLHRSW